ncbi:MAG: hypothetical protein WCG80_06790 [Spirochaetales bacterium]
MRLDESSNGLHRAVRMLDFLSGLLARNVEGLDEHEAEGLCWILLYVAGQLADGEQ